MRYAKVTFNPHINETHLIDEFLILLNPLLNKHDSFCLTREKSDEPGVHLHAIIPMTQATPGNHHVVQKFKSPGWTNFKKKLIQTEWDPKLATKCLQAQLLEIDKDPQNPHNYLYFLGYINKEKSVLLDSKGYSQDFLTSAVQYYYQNSRKEDTINKNNVIYDLNAKNCKGYMTHFCEKHDISLNDKMLPVRLAEKGVALDNISQKQLVRIIAFLNIHKHQTDPSILSEFEIRYYESCLTDDVTTEKVEMDIYIFEKHKMERIENENEVIKAENKKLKALLAANNVNYKD